MTLTIVIIVIAITHFLSALTGFGCTILAMPFMIQIVGIGIAKPVLLVMGTLQPLTVGYSMRKYIRWDILKIILAISGVGLPIGYFLYSYLPEHILLAVLGVVMLFAGSMGIARLRGIHFNAIPKIILFIALFIGGILQGAFVSGGPLIVIYASLVLHDKDEFRATLSLLWIVLNSVTIIQSLLTGQFTPEVNKMVLLNLPFLFLAVLLGNKLAMKVSKKVFDYILNIVLLVGGVITITNQFM